MGYLNIIEENFTKSDYVAYLRGSILMWLLEDKPLDTKQFKLYANKLVEVLSEQQADTECPCLQAPAPEQMQQQPTVDPDEPKDLGWTATVNVAGVDCKNAWVADAKNMELLPTTLQANTWYHTTDFTLEELKELLPKGTRLQVEKQVLYGGIKTTPPTETLTTTVESVTTSFLTEEPLIETTGGAFLKEWFMLAE